MFPQLLTFNGFYMRTCCAVFGYNYKLTTTVTAKNSNLSCFYLQNRGIKRALVSGHHICFDQQDIKKNTRLVKPIVEVCIYFNQRKEI